MISLPEAFALYLSFVGPVAWAQQSGNATTPTVTLNSGPIRGRTTQLPDSETTVNQFLGIPFARPPIEDLRFAPPQEPAIWEDVYDATSQPSACMQYSSAEGEARVLADALFNNPAPPGESEDCLYVNIYAPSGGDGGKPVMFWIYGGANLGGAASLPLYDGTSIAANQDIIVVVANYRINVFGNPRSPQIPLSERSPGQLDLILALNWTTQNIHLFGGDPEKMTIMGESHGAVAVGHLVNMWPDSPPFRGAVQMSGSAVIKPPFISPSDPDAAWPALVELLNCTDTADEAILECVRSVPAETIKAVLEANQLVFSDVVANNVTAPERPDLLWLSGNVARVPLLIGSTADDGSFFVRDLALAAEASGLDLAGLLEQAGTDEELTQLILGMYGPDSPYFDNLNSTRDAISQFATDSIFGCTSGFVANLTSALLDVPVWQYVFDALTPSNTWEQWPDLGVYHASELPILFGTYFRENSTDVEARLSASMQKQFADFVKDPQSGPGWDQWPEVAVLAVNDTDAVTTTRDVRELDPVCSQYDLVYLAQLPALAQLGGNEFSNTSTPGTNESGGGQPSSPSSGDENVAARPQDGIMGLAGIVLLVVAAML